MKKQILFLVELQNIDLEIDEFMRRKINLPEAIERLDEELKTVEQTLEEDGQRLERLKVDHKTKETALKNSIDNARKTKGRLLEVKTNKEYEATLKEIDTVNEKSSAIEDEIIHILEEIDRVSEDLKVKEKKTNDCRFSCEERKKRFEEELNSIDSALTDVLKRRDIVRSRVQEQLLKKFDVIKNRKHGRAVVPARKEVCYGCHMNIPPQMYNELQKSDRLILCPHCERIIYWEGVSDDA